MSNYTKATNFAIKDGLVTTDPAKVIKGTEIDNEYNAISSAISSKADVNSPSLTGSPTAPTASLGSNTTQVATTAFVTAATVAERTATATYTDKTLTSPTINTPAITGGTVSGAAITGGSISSLASAIPVASGGTGVTTSTGTGSTVLSASPSLTDVPTAPTASVGTNTTQIATTAFVNSERTSTSTLTNKTLTSPTINSPTISGGTITGITDLAVADGGTGSSTLAANAVLLGNGTSALQTVAPSTSGNVLKSNGTTWTSAPLKGLGLGGEVWNDVTSSRANSTTYTNSRSYPILVNAGFSGNSLYGTATVAGVQVWGQTNQGNGSAWTASFIVPAGATYSISVPGSSAVALSFWSELY